MPRRIITKLSAIAPVYVSLGNHETEYLERYGTDLIPLYQDAGATVLEQDYVDVTVHGQNLRIGGLYSYCLSWRYLDSGGADPAECAFLSEFQDTDAYTMLLCHMPVCWIQGNSLEDWDVDCVFSGHIHGGQIVFRESAACMPRIWDGSREDCGDCILRQTGNPRWYCPRGWGTLNGSPDSTTCRRS